MSLRGEAVAISRLLRSLRFLATTLEGAKINSSDKSESDKFLLGSRIGRPRFLAKIPKAFHKLSFESPLVVKRGQG